MNIERFSMLHKFTILLALPLFMLACQATAQLSVGASTCHDGWSYTTTSDGVPESSELWNPPPSVAKAVGNKLPANRHIDCWHKFPSGSIVVVSTDTGGQSYATDFKPQDGSYVVTGETYVIGAE